MSMNRLTRRVLSLAMSLAMAGVAGTAAAGDTSAAPALLSETGLYSDPASLRVDPGHLSFEPQYPLWTDGAEKSRWIHLPQHTAIDASDTGNWVLPVGTKLWKEFAFAGRKVETRMIWRASEDRWIYATYVWNDEQTDALLAPEGGIRNHAKIGEKAWHSIPSATDCSSCHDPSAKPVLGFSALQLSDDRDALAPHAKPLGEGMVTIATLETLGLLSPRRPDLVANPPRIHSDSPRERAVLGYLSTNCGSCHNAGGTLALLGMNLYQQPTGDGAFVESVLPTTVDVAGHWHVPGLNPGESRRIAPGAPEASSIVYRMSSRHPSSRMPPIGSTVVDEEALALIREWIAIDLRSRQ